MLTHAQDIFQTVNDIHMRVCVSKVFYDMCVCVCVFVYGYDF